MTIGLLAYAMAKKVQFRRVAFWWALLALLVILSHGAYWTIGTWKIPLPALFLKKYIPLFRPIRVPARFNLFAAVIAAIIAAAGLKHMLSGMPNRFWRVVLASTLAIVAVADLSSIQYATWPVAKMPPGYQWLLDREPKAVFLEVPQCNYGFALPAACTYWQSYHHARTSAGYTASPNFRQENLLMTTSPFNASLLALPDYLKDSAPSQVDILPNAQFDDYAWLYLNYYDFPYVIVHHRYGSFPETPLRLDRLESRLSHALIFNDSETAIFERTRFKPPLNPTILCARGWGYRVRWEGKDVRTVEQKAQMVIYNPTPTRELKIKMKASAHRKVRTVILRREGVEIARWIVKPGVPQSLVSLGFMLSEGMQTLCLECDGAELPSRRTPPVEADLSPISLLVSSVELEPTSP